MSGRNIKDDNLKFFAFCVVLLFVFILSVIILAIFYSERNTGNGFRSPNHVDFENTISETSTVGVNEFRCEGTCYCDENSSRRVSGAAKILHSGLTLFLVSVTGVLAHKKAKEYFTSECKLSFGDDSCPIDSVFSEVTQCDQVSVQHEANDFNTHEDLYGLFEEYRKLRSEQMKERKRTTKKTPEYFYGFRCSGKCLPHQQAPTEGPFVFDCDDYELEDVFMQVPINDYTDEKGHEEVAKALFASERLSFHCAILSHPDDRKQEQRCISMVNGRNPSVECKRTKNGKFIPRSKSKAS